MQSVRKFHASGLLPPNHSAIHVNLRPKRLRAVQIDYKTGALLLRGYGAVFRPPPREADYISLNLAALRGGVKIHLCDGCNRAHDMVCANNLGLFPRGG